MIVRARVPLALVALGVVALGAAPAPAGAAPNATAAGPGSGSATLALGGPALKSLKAQGVRISPRKPARGSAKRIVLPVFGGQVGDSARVLLGGGLTLTRKTPRGTRRAALTLLEVRLGPGSSRTLARVAGRQRALLAVSHAKRRPSIDRSTGRTSIRAAAVRLTKPGAAAIRKALGLRRLAPASFGRLTVTARLSGAGSPGAPPGGTPGAPNPAPIPNEPPVLARPAGAVDVSGATITWDVRDSFIRYINNGEGTSTSEGATPGPEEVREGTSTPLVYTFFYPFARGWYDSASGKAGLYYTGTVRFRYRSRGIDFYAKDPEVEINGEDSRAIFRFDGRESTDFENKRAVLVDLDLGRASRTVSPDGKQITYSKMPGSIPQGTADSIFAGFYQPGEEFGNISVSFTTP